MIELEREYLTEIEAVQRSGKRPQRSVHIDRMTTHKPFTFSLTNDLVTGSDASSNLVIVARFWILLIG